MVELTRIQKVTVVSLLLILAITAAYYGLRTPPAQNVSQALKPEGLARMSEVANQQPAQPQTQPQPPILRPASPVPAETPVESSPAPISTAALPSTQQQTGSTSAEPLSSASVTTLEVNRKRLTLEVSADPITESTHNQSQAPVITIISTTSQPSGETSPTSTAIPATTTRANENSVMISTTGEPSQFGMPMTPSPDQPPVDFGFMAPVNQPNQPANSMQQNPQPQLQMAIQPLPPPPPPPPMNIQPPMMPMPDPRMQPMPPMQQMPPIQPMDQQQPPADQQQKPHMGWDQQQQPPNSAMISGL